MTQVHNKITAEVLNSITTPDQVHVPPTPTASIQTSHYAMEVPAASAEATTIVTAPRPASTMTSSKSSSAVSASLMTTAPNRTPSVVPTVSAATGRIASLAAMPATAQRSRSVKSETAFRLAGNRP